MTTASPEKAEAKLQALVVDDAFALEEGADWWDDDERWALFLRRLQSEHPPGITDVEAAQFEEQQDHREDTVDTLRARVGGQGFDRALREATGDRPTVEAWVQQLRELGWDVVTTTGVADVERQSPDGELAPFVRRFSLILLDFELVIGDNGAASQAFAERLSEIVLDPATERPPQLIKFSRHPIEGIERERTEFAEEVRYPRGCYEFMAKALAADATTFPAILEGALSAGVVGQRMFAAARAMRRTIEKVVADHMTEMLLLRVDATGLRVMFRDKLKAEGMTELDYLVEIVTSLLAQRIRASEDVAADVTAFVDSLGEPRPGEPAETSGLNELEIELASDAAGNKFRRPIDFGDIFLFDPETVAVLITPQCDLMVRGNGRIATDMVTVRLGRQHLDHEWKPRFKDAADGREWSIEWTEQLVVIPRLVLDLCTLRTDGRARLQQDEEHFPYWTQAYADFSSRQLETARSLMKSVGKKRLLAATAPGIAGSGLKLRHDFAVDKDGFIPVQRLCRLRYAETLELLQQSLADAARVGLMPELDARVETASVEIVGKAGGKAIATLQARVTNVGGRRFVDVETPALREALGAAEEWTALRGATAVSESRFDLEAGSSAVGYRLNRPGKPPVFKLLLPKPEAPSGPGSEAATMSAEEPLPAQTEPSSGAENGEG